MQSSHQKFWCPLYLFRPGPLLLGLPNGSPVLHCTHFHFYIFTIFDHKNIETTPKNGKMTPKHRGCPGKKQKWLLKSKQKEPSVKQKNPKKHRGHFYNKKQRSFVKYCWYWEPLASCQRSTINLFLCKVTSSTCISCSCFSGGFVLCNAIHKMIFKFLLWADQRRLIGKFTFKLFIRRGLFL